MNRCISIITPSFNQGQFLEQTINSVLSQNYPKLQYIIIDGGSSDNSKEIIKKYERHLSYWISEKDSGQSHAINKGLAKVNGEIVNWINSDDYLEPGSLKVINENFSEPSTNVVIGRSHIVKGDRIVKTTNGTDIYDNLSKTIGWARIDQPETYFRRNVFDELGLLNEKLCYVMDKEFWLRYLFKFGLTGIKKIPNTLANFRWHNDSKTISQREGFISETNYLYSQLALQSGLNDEVAFMNEKFQISNNSNTLFNNVKLDSSLVQKAFNYFLLYKADEAYYKSDYANCKLLLSKVSLAKLDIQDQKLAKKINFRSNYLPNFIIKLARLWRQA